MKHTKGPWIASAPYVKVNTNLGYILTLADYDRATQVADSHLIAAAPEMLEILESFLGGDDLESRFYAVVEVVKKAKGEI